MATCSEATHLCEPLPLKTNPLESNPTSVSCESCDVLKQLIDKLRCECDLLKRANARLWLSCKYAQRKVCRMAKEKVAARVGVRKFLGCDQVKALRRKSNRGAQWNKETVKNGLKLHFACGPSGYKELLMQKYPLPSPRTLRRCIQHVRFESGILDEVFQYLEVKTSAMAAQERDCVPTLDEMAIKPSVEFDKRTCHFIGDVTLPDHSGPATHSLVFMLGGITTRWKQTVSYYFTGNSTDGTVFCRIITDIILCAKNIGLNVLAFTSDMGSANRAMWKRFGIVSTKDKCKCTFPHPSSPDKCVYVFADVPHLVKNLRNHIVKGHDLVLPAHVVAKFNLPTSVVCVQPLRKLVEYQADKDLKPAPKLTAKHLDPGHFEKMKVSNAMAVFSSSVSAALRLMVETENWDVSFLTTAWFLETINHWFDLMSSRHPILALSKFNEAKYCEAVDFLRLIVDMFEHIRISYSMHCFQDTGKRTQLSCLGVPA